MVLADGMVCSAVWAVLQSLSEITIVFPVSGNSLTMPISGLTLPWLSERVSLSSLICTFKENMTSHYSDNHNSMERNCRIRSGLLQCAGAVLGRGIFASRSYRLVYPVTSIMGMVDV